MTRRANGEGSIYRRKDGRWVAAIYVLRADGGRVRRQVYGKTRGEVSAQLTAIAAKTAAGVPMAVERWTFRTYSEHWLDHVARARLRPSTLSSYRMMLRLHLWPTLGEVKLHAITPAKVRALLGAKREEDLSDRSVQLVHATLRTVLAEAVRDELVERNVAALVRVARPERREVAPWSPAEAAQFLRKTRGHRLHALFSVGVAVGLRRGELLGLRWSDVDWDAGTVRVRRVVQRVQGEGLVIGPPKTARSRRVVPLPSSSLRQLREHRSLQLAERLVARSEWQDEDLVFASTHGTVIEPRNLSRLFDALIKTAGVRRIRFHDLRHTCASLLLAQGVPARVVMDVLGHSQIAVTMDLYSHVMPSALREAADAMDRALGDS